LPAGSTFSASSVFGVPRLVSAFWTKQSFGCCACNGNECAAINGNANAAMSRGIKLGVEKTPGE
jgi:hypothetical protein